MAYDFFASSKYNRFNNCYFDHHKTYNKVTNNNVTNNMMMIYVNVRY